MTVHAIAVIPARYASSRLPGKPLVELAGAPMVEHVWRRACASSVQGVVVATDDERIARAVEVFGGTAVMTSTEHRCGTTRVHEAVQDLDCEVVVNVQGDEPLVDPSVIDALVAAFDDASVQIATLAAPGDDEGAVRVLVDEAGDAVDFRRGPISGSLQHLGLYAYRREALEDFVSLGPTAREERERLEQLRLLDHGRRIRVVVVESASPSVDTLEDLARVRKILEEHI
ncbi:MAG TPA: 3-deoxy-manno-octulosonate cytidylyltransferase [Myxococcota bacterium]|nr:3-deoxy-manno-octulosonate cytidylyltransferase [Myxococcota bacterium]